MTKKIKKKYIFFIFCIQLLLLFDTAYAKKYSEIKILGNERLSLETIIMFSGLNLEREIEKKDLNDAIKKLYKTNYFKIIKITTKNDIIQIDIQENPIIQSIKINGVKNKSINEKLLEITKKSEKYPFLQQNIKKQKNLLLNVIRGSGFYFANVEVKVINNQNNSVDLLYDFNLGKRAIIKKINFQGNKIFRDTKLRNVIKSEEGKFWKFITSNKYLDEAKIKKDEILLEKYYKNKGYFNVKIKSSYAKNINNEFFELNFNINSGIKYFFNNLILEDNENLDIETLDQINQKLFKFKGKKYSLKKLNLLVDEIDNLALQ